MGVPLAALVVVPVDSDLARHLVAQEAVPVVREAVPAVDQVVVPVDPAVVAAGVAQLTGLAPTSAKAVVVVAIRKS